MAIDDRAKEKPSPVGIGYPHTQWAPSIVKYLPRPPLAPVIFGIGVGSSEPLGKTHVLYLLGIEAFPPLTCLHMLTPKTLSSRTTRLGGSLGRDLVLRENGKAKWHGRGGSGDRSYLIVVAEGLLAISSGP